jgi:hypothetical protein
MTQIKPFHPTPVPVRKDHPATYNLQLPASPAMSKNNTSKISIPPFNFIILHSYFCICILPPPFPPLRRPSRPRYTYFLTAFVPRSSRRKEAQTEKIRNPHSQIRNVTPALSDQMGQ